MPVTTFIDGVCYDGVSAAAQTARLSIHGLSVTVSYGEASFSEPLAWVDFGQATTQGLRLISLSNGIQFQAQEGQALSAYLEHHRAGRSWVDRATANWRWVAACAAGVVATVAVFYLWGIPLMAQAAAPLVPQSVRNHLGDSALSGLDRYAFTASAIDAASQAKILERWQSALNQAYPDKHYPPHRVLFRKMGEVPNAMALPNGVIVLTDGLVTLLNDKPDTLIGVLAHELGHLDHHHSMRALIEFSSLGLISSLALGDYTVWFNQLPVLLGQMSYSRGHESEADDAAIRIMKAAKINPAELALFFERAEKLAENKNQPKPDKEGQTKTPWTVPDLLRSHPSSVQRMAKLRGAGQQPGF